MRWFARREQTLALDATRSPNRNATPTHAVRNRVRRPSHSVEGSSASPTDRTVRREQSGCLHCPCSPALLFSLRAHTLLLTCMHAAFCFECRRGIRTTACQQLAQQHRIRPSQNVMADGQPPDVLLLENRSLRQKLMRIQNLFMQLLIACYSQPNNIGAVLGDIQQVLNESSDVISPGAGAESHVWWWLHHIYHQQAPQPMHSCSPRVQQPCCHSHRAQPATATLGSPACRCSSTRCSSNRAPRQQPPSRARPDPIRHHRPGRGTARCAPQAVFGLLVQH